MGGDASKIAVTGAPNGADLPLAFNLYYEKSWGLKIRLGEHQHHCVYSAAFPAGFYGDLVLYNGPSCDQGGAPLAKAERASKLRSHSMITLPSPAPGAPPIQEEMRSEGTVHTCYTFSMAVGTGHATMPQKFEWRRAKKEELEPLGESSRGFKLLYGDEIVAIWADASISRKNLTKAARFMFVNSGATGQFGIWWALMAVTTFVRAWQLQTATTITTATTSSVSAGSAAAISG